MRASRRPILVVGAGLAGLCVARELALQGRSVTLFSDPNAGAASRAASGLLQLAGGRISSTHLALRRACWESYGDFLATLGIAGTLRYGGHLRLGEWPSVDGFASTLRGLGLEAAALTGEQLAQSEPSLAKSLSGAARLPAAALDPELLLTALLGSLEKLGVTFVPTRILARQGTNLLGDDGENWSGSGIVLACGQGLSALSDFDWSFREEPGWGATFRGSLCLSHSLESPQHQETLVPLSAEHWRIGGNGEAGPERPSLAGLVSWRGQEVARQFGTRVTAPDGLPVVGAIDRVLFVLGGLGRNGMLTAPRLAAGLAEQIASGVCPPWLVPFSPHRPEIERKRSWSR